MSEIPNRIDLRRLMAPLQIAAGGALVVTGILIVASYLIATAPGQAGGDALKAVGVVTARSEVPSGWRSGKFLDSTLVYTETFQFIDRFGIEHTAEDQVSALFYGNHPEGSHIDVLYYANAPANAVIDSPNRLLPQANAILAAFGLAAMGIGGALALAGITAAPPAKRVRA